MNKIMFTGSIVALITPMNQKGAIDLNSLKRLIDYHVSSGTSAILITGTTGEMSTLSYEEHGDVVMWALEFSDERLPIIVGTGANSTSLAVSLTSRFNDSGIAGCLNVTPYYNLPNQEGLFEHFKTIAEHSSLPQILYNVPVRTGCDMKPETVARLSKIDNIIGIKEATGDLNRLIEIKNLVDPDFLLLSGHDASALDFMQLGGKGVISVTANLAAKEMAQLCALVRDQKYLDAQKLNQRLMILHKKLFFESNPIPVKWACKVLGLITDDTLRLPMTPLTEIGKNVVKKALIDAGFL